MTWSQLKLFVAISFQIRVPGPFGREFQLYEIDLDRIWRVISGFDVNYAGVIKRVDEDGLARTIRQAWNSE